MYHRKRENVWSLLYCIVLRSAEGAELLKKEGESCIVLLKESLAEWGCSDIGSYALDRFLILKLDAPPTLNIPAFVNAFKTRTGRLYKSGKRGLWRPGYFVATMGSPSDAPEESYIEDTREEGCAGGAGKEQG